MGQVVLSLTRRPSSTRGWYKGGVVYLNFSWLLSLHIVLRMISSLRLLISLWIDFFLKFHNTYGGDADDGTGSPAEAFH